MKYAELYADGKFLDRVRVADSYFARLRGLMGKRDIRTGLLLRPCAQVHTYFMKEPIDVVYLDRKGRVLSVETAMEPGRVGFYIHGANAVLELPANRWATFHCSDLVYVKETAG